MAEIRVFEDTPSHDWCLGQCMCSWREDLPCPNQATWRVENTTNEGFSDMCTPHKEDFAALWPEAFVRYVALEGGG